MKAQRYDEDMDEFVLIEECLKGNNSSTPDAYLPSVNASRILGTILMNLIYII